VRKRRKEGRRKILWRNTKRRMRSKQRRKQVKGESRGREVK
jgi:hypothetical protein